METYPTRQKILLFLVFIVILFFTFFINSAFAGKSKTKNSDKSFNDYRFQYKIGVGDILEIMTWKEPDFSRANVLVRLDGKITMPLLDDILAAGKTPHQLKENIQTLLKHYVATPNVTVVVREPASQKYYIIGEVQRVGEYPLLKNLTIVQAFAMAGGFTEWATKKEIILLRKLTGNSTKVIKVDYKKILRGKGLEQNIGIRADDTIIVP